MIHNYCGEALASGPLDFRFPRSSGHLCTIAVEKFPSWRQTETLSPSHSILEATPLTGEVEIVSASPCSLLPQLRTKPPQRSQNSLVQILNLILSRLPPVWAYEISRALFHITGDWQKLSPSPSSAQSSPRAGRKKKEKKENYASIRRG